MGYSKKKKEICAIFGCVDVLHLLFLGFLWGVPGVLSNLRSSCGSEGHAAFKSSCTENQDILGPIEPIDSWPLMTHQTTVIVTRQIRQLSTVTVAVYLGRSKSHFPASLHLLWGNSTVYSTIHYYSSRFLSFSVKFWNLLILIDSSMHRDDTRDVQQSFVLKQRFLWWMTVEQWRCEDPLFI